MAGFLFHRGVKTALALAALASLPCLADRVFEMTATTNAPAVYHVPEGKLVTILGRSYGRKSENWVPSAYLKTEITRGETTITNSTYFEQSLDEVGNTVAGPAKLIFSLSGFAGTKRPELLLIKEWEATATIPASAPVVPAGSSGVVTIETSSDLETWQPAISTNLPAATTNRFFRIKIR